MIFLIFRNRYSSGVTLCGQIDEVFLYRGLQGGCGPDRNTRERKRGETVDLR